MLFDIICGFVCSAGLTACLFPCQKLISGLDKRDIFLTLPVDILRLVAYFYCSAHSKSLSNDFQGQSSRANTGNKTHVTGQVAAIIL